MVIAAVANTWSVLVPVYVALDKGFWRDFGLTDTEIKVVGPAPTHVASLVGGSIDFSINITTDTLMRANANGSPVYAIAGSTNGNSYVLYGKGVQSLQELKGKKIATDAPGGPIETMTADILRKGGVDPKEVQFVPVGGTIPERLQAMLTGVTSAAMASVADWPSLQRQGVVILARGSDAFPDYQFAVLGTHEKMLRQYPATVVAFLKGMIRAWQFLSDPRNDQEAARILKAHNVPFDEALWSELLATQRPFWPRDGSLNMKGVEFVLHREKEAKRVPADYTLDKFLRLEPLQQAQRELGLR